MLSPLPVALLVLTVALRPGTGAGLGLSGASAPSLELPAPTLPAVAAPLRDAADPVQPERVCYERLGCFSTDAPWWSLLRPLPAPESPERIGTRLLLCTRSKPEPSEITLVPEVSLRDLDFNAQCPTFFITHGFISDSKLPWVVDMKNAILEKMDANVILVDWAPGAAGPIKYMQVAANTRVVGAEVARAIKYMMKENNISAQNIHLVGHSLGAQISAYVGKEVKAIGRISALDPAQPAFEGYDRRVRLDASDASFVEVIHTDAKPTIPLFGLGMMGAYGDVDYYINGGYTQPGCFPMDIPPLNSLTDFLKLSVQTIGEIVACPHGRSTLLFTETIRQNCTFWGHPGNVVENAVGAVSHGYLHRYLTPSNEDCTVKNCSPLNMENERYPARGSFVVATTSAKPYCIAEPEVDGRMRSEVDNILRGVGRGAVDALGGVAKSIPTLG